MHAFLIMHLLTRTNRLIYRRRDKNCVRYRVCRGKMWPVASTNRPVSNSGVLVGLAWWGNYVFIPVSLI